MPRGRPKGAKNKPKTIAVEDATPMMEQPTQPMSFVESLQMGFNHDDVQLAQEIRNVIDNEDAYDPYEHEQYDDQEPYDDENEPPAQPPAYAPTFELHGDEDDDEFGNIFAKKPAEQTAILGKDKRELLTRIKEYKLLFPK